MYIRKDVAAQIWQYGASTGSVTIGEDPYAEGTIELSPSLTISEIGLNNPKGIASAPDGSIYVADTGNHRILHVSSEGTILGQWGSEGIEIGQFRGASTAWQNHQKRIMDPGELQSTTRVTFC
jgi:hypothetical protein